MGWIGAVQLAAHGIALQVSTVAFMVQLGLSNAATVRAGRSLGRQDHEGLRDGALTVWGLGFLFALVTVVIYLTLPEVLMGAFVDPADPLRPQIIAIGVSLLAMAALFQIADSAQVMGISVLRGMQDTRTPMLMAAFAYWGIGAPAMWLFGLGLGGGAVGVWVGLVAGLSASAIMVALRFRHLLRQV
jgi:MATE family multidrug resistance protein